jgi:hypothetical protein
MKALFAACAFGAAMSVAASAQDTKVESKTTVKTDEASVASLTGCLQRDVAGQFTLLGTVVKGDDDLTTKTKVRTEVDNDRTRVKAESETKAEDGRVGTTGAMTMFMLTPRSGVALNQYVGQQVQISAVTVDPDHKDADVKIEEKTTVDPEHGDDSTKRTKTKLEVDRAAGHYTVVSVKSLGTSCN